VTARITRTMQKASATLKKTQSKLGKTIGTLDTLNTTVLENKINSGRNQLAFIYDLFNVDFSGGPFHTMCWVKYVMNHYVSSSENASDIYSLLCLINDIYVDINESVIGFIGSALDMIIPESVGIAGTVAPMLKGYSYVLYNIIRDQITDNYNQIPLDFRLLIQNPDKMAKYIFAKFNTYSLGLSDLVIPTLAKQYMSKGIDVLAYSIHKGMAMVYMFLNVFIIFSEMNVGINNTLTKKNLNVELLLKQCVDCGTLELTGLNETGEISQTDMTECSRCKKFFVDDETVKIDDKELYDRCVNYQQDRNAMKLNYTSAMNTPQTDTIQTNNVDSNSALSVSSLPIASGSPLITDSTIVNPLTPVTPVTPLTPLNPVSPLTPLTPDLETHTGGYNKKNKQNNTRICTLAVLRKMHYDNQKTLPIKICKTCKIV